MEWNKSVSNPMLVGMIELMKADPTQDHKKMFVEEMMKAKYLTPAVIEPKPEKDGNGRAQLTPGNKIRFPMLNAPDGKSFYMAFTDSIEFRKWKKEEQDTLVLTFPEYAGLILRKGNTAAGFVINPFGGNIVISRDMLMSLAAGIQKAREEKKETN